MAKLTAFLCAAAALLGGYLAVQNFQAHESSLYVFGYGTTAAILAVTALICVIYAVRES